MIRVKSVPLYFARLDRNLSEIFHSLLRSSFRILPKIAVHTRKIQLDKFQWYHVWFYHLTFYPIGSHNRSETMFAVLKFHPQ